MWDKSHQTQGPASLVKLLGVQWPKRSCHTFALFFTARKRAQYLIVFFGFCREQAARLDVLLQSIYREIYNIAICEWCQKDAKAL